MAEVRARTVGHPLLPAALRGRSARRLRIALTVAAALVLAQRIHAWWVSPEHRIAQFVAAGARGDAESLLALADPIEVKRLGLSAGKLAAMLAAAVGAPGAVTMGDLQWVPLREPQNGYNRWAQVTLFGTKGSRVVSTTGEPATVIVQAYNTDAGWKVGASKLLYAAIVARNGMAFRKQRYAALCMRYGVPPECYWPERGEWERMPLNQSLEP